MLRYGFMIVALAAFLPACSATEKRDYAAQASCDAMGYRPGNADYDKCVREEKSIRLMEQQRHEYEDMKQQQQDQILRRY